jgi:hypothetical protein
MTIHRAREKAREYQGATDHRRLILVLVDRHLVVAVSHEFPIIPFRLFGDRG